jgi:hypothetical protein
MIFLLTLLLISIVALIAAILIVVKVRRSGSSNIYLLLVFVPFIVAVLMITLLTRTPTRIYLQDFKEVTGVDMPEDAKIQYKSSSFRPSDDHASLMLVHVGREFYTILPSLLVKNGLSEVGDSMPHWMKKLIANYGEMQVEQTFQLKEGKLDHSAYLLSDSASVLIRRQKFKFEIHGDEDAIQ